MSELQIFAYDSPSLEGCIWWFAVIFLLSSPLWYQWFRTFIKYRPGYKIYVAEGSGIFQTRQMFVLPPDMWTVWDCRGFGVALVCYRWNGLRWDCDTYHRSIGMDIEEYNKLRDTTRCELRGFALVDHMIKFIEENDKLRHYHITFKQWHEENRKKIISQQEKDKS